jgi:glycine hydroxymethyltransferase
MHILSQYDPKTARIVEAEAQRQAHGITLIASENYASRAILEAAGTVFTNKYVDNTPGHRDYPCCAWADEIEVLARDRLCHLFGADHANVQPYCGSAANMAVLFATLSPGDTIMSLKVEDGGHHTHGSAENFSGRLYNAVRYGVDPETGLLDYEVIADLARKTKPAMLICGASMYPRTIDFRLFAEIAEDCNALCLADVAHIAGLIAAGFHPSPVGHIPLVTMSTHKTLRGPRGGAIICTKDLGDAIDQSVYPCLQGGPLMHIIAAKSVCFHEALQPSFGEYVWGVLTNAQTLASALGEEGLQLACGGTDTHLMVVDLNGTGISGGEAETALQAAGICADRCPVPGRGEDFSCAGGIRIGTPAVSTRGMGEEEMKVIGHCIGRLLQNPHNADSITEVRMEIKELACQYPPYHEIN